MKQEFDYLNPDYGNIVQKRLLELDYIVKHKDELPVLKEYYRQNPWDFINDWGCTFDPRNPAKGLPSMMPFILFPRQIEFLKWMHERRHMQERGIAEKSRDMGVTWLVVAYSATMLLFENGFIGGFGSRKEDLVDKLGDEKSIFEKTRIFLRELPAIFLPPMYLDSRKHQSHMRISSPENDSAIIGEAGDQIGRGGRTSIYVVDEAAFIDHQDVVDRALSQNTDCQIDVSTPNGPGNLFYKKRLRFNNTRQLFIFDWRDDPRKDDTWYRKQKENEDEVTVAQEIDRDYNASQEGSFIPAKWVAAAVDAHIRLGFEATGIRATGFDPADVGDAKAIVNRYGSVITEADQKKDGDITHAIPWAFEYADQARADVLMYDGDGLGAPAMKLALKARAVNRVKVMAYHGSAGVLDPTKAYGENEYQVYENASKKIRDDLMHKGELKTNKDMFINFRAQSWTWLRDRFHATYVAIERANQGKLVNADPEKLISISSQCKCLTQLMAELSSPMRIFTPNGKIAVESKKHMKERGVDSPNLADGAVISFSARGEPKKGQNPQPTISGFAPTDPGMGY